MPAGSMSLLLSFFRDHVALLLYGTLTVVQGGVLISGSRSEVEGVIGVTVGVLGATEYCRG